MINYTEDFNQLWAIYPKRAGGNPKPKAFKAFTARLKEKVDYSELEAGLRRYSEFCKQTGKIDTEYTQRASTFFGVAGEAWLETWTVSKSEVKQDKQGFPAGFDPSRQCNQGESLESCKSRAWRESGVR